ncbi:hypothetical protein ACFLXQ_05810 [Chloroflexota bacterium]
MLVFGIIALVKGEFKITRSRKVKGDVGRALGVVMLIGAGAPLFAGEYGGAIQIVILIIVIIIGLATSEKIE